MNSKVLNILIIVSKIPFLKSFLQPMQPFRKPVNPPAETFQGDSFGLFCYALSPNGLPDEEKILTPGEPHADH